MWIFVLFDLPTQTKGERRAATRFRKDLLDHGFGMFQYSIYLRHCSSREAAATHIKRVKQLLPLYGKVDILRVTDKQFGMMESFINTRPRYQPPPPGQLTLF